MGQAEASMTVIAEIVKADLIARSAHRDAAVVTESGITRSIVITAIGVQLAAQSRVARERIVKLGGQHERPAEERQRPPQAVES